MEDKKEFFIVNWSDHDLSTWVGRSMLVLRGIGGKPSYLVHCFPYEIEAELHQQEYFAIIAEKDTLFDDNLLFRNIVI